MTVVEFKNKFPGISKNSLYKFKFYYYFYLIYRFGFVFIRKFGSFFG